MANGRCEQKFHGDDLDLYLANEAGVGVRALAKQHGISKSVVAARIARVRDQLNADPWTEGAEAAPTEAARQRGSVRAYTYSD